MSLFGLSVSTAKISILLLYKRIFSVGRFHIVANILIGIIVAWAITFVCIIVFQCTPPDALWNELAPKSCIDLSSALIATSTINAATDVIILLMPIPYIWKLQTTITQKWMLTGIFLTGGL
jgi:archaellum biogenesis protein FlaJ (TadC family)